MILIQNVYHMLAYAFRVLNENGYKSIATERFENTAELCAAILIQGMKSQIKRGLNKSYISVFENTSLIKGKINVAESYKTGIYLKKQLHCTYDEFTEDSYLNRIIKCSISSMRVLKKAQPARLLRGQLQKWTLSNTLKRGTSHRKCSIRNRE